MPAPDRRKIIVQKALEITFLKRICFAFTAFLLVVSPRSYSAGATTFNLQVEVISSQILTSSYLQVEATMSGLLVRDDGSSGTYKVPMIFVYPLDSAQCRGVGIVDVINSVFYETFDSTGTVADPLFPSIFPFARMILGDDFIQNRGYVYAHVQWNKLVIERQRQADMLEDP